MRAAEIGRKSGLSYIYAGNLPGEVGDLENTRCPNCQQLLIERYGYLVSATHAFQSVLDSRFFSIDINPAPDGVGFGSPWLRSDGIVALLAETTGIST